MPVSGKSTKPSAQAQIQFDLLMELYELNQWHSQFGIMLSTSEMVLF